MQRFDQSRVEQSVAHRCAVHLGMAVEVVPERIQVSPRDPLVFGVAAMTLVLVAIAATLVPARRAAGVSPVVALRSDE